MITQDEKELLATATKDSLLLLNGHYKWSFLDEYLFTEMQKDASSPSQTMHADGNVSDNGVRHIAQLYVTWHCDLQKWSSCLCIFDDTKHVIESLDIFSIEKTL